LKNESWVILITGGTRGIGAAIAAQLHGRGHRVYVTQRTQVQSGRQDGLQVLSLDITSAASVEACVHELLRREGHIDVLVNNAGGGVILPTLEHTEESLRTTVDNNLWTTIYCVRAALPHMVSRGHGRIINIGADSVRTGLVDHAMYNAAKGGVHAMVTGLAREFAAVGITANTVAPCYVRTPELVRLFDSGQAPARLAHVVEQATAIVPIGRPGDPAEVATAVAFLAGEDSRFITGQTIYVNGGSSMG